MSEEKIILLLSDSTSTTLGVEREIHHMQLADRNIWPPNTKILNCSIPGMTAADAATYYAMASKKYGKSIVSVFIYLGNCDTIAMEFSKGNFTKTKYLKHKLSDRLFGGKSKAKLRNRLLYNEWNNQVDLTIEKAEDPIHFKNNIEYITQSCKQKSIPVILVKSQANKNFIPGLAKGNFLFYKYLGLEDKFSATMQHEDERFKAALSLHEKKDFAQASIEYKNILDNPAKEKFNAEYALVLLNNYAVAKAELNEFEEAKVLLNLYIEEKSARKEIAYYNLAQIAKRENQVKVYRELLQRSFETDHYLYRIRKPYQDALEEIAQQNKAIHFVKLESLLSSEHYLDHCHPLPHGQKILADSFEQKYSLIGLKGNDKATIVNDLYNPELANGNFSPFKDYFKSISTLSKDEINKQFIALFKLANKDVHTLENAQISSSIVSAYKYYFKHPLFVTEDDLKSIETFYPSDIGRFPEFMFFRYLVPYLKEIEETAPALFESFNHETQLVNTSESFQQLLAQQKILGLQVLTTGKPFTKEKIKRILEKLETNLLSHLEEGNQIFNRTKATIFWYVRETLRFGSHSRYSMRYNRVLIEYMSEALIICQYFNQKENFDLDQKILQLKKALLSTVKIHEEYCRKFNLQEVDTTLMVAYDTQLKRIINQLN